MVVRTCNKCGLEKPLTEYRESKPGYRRRVCNECMDRTAVEWQQQNRDRLLGWRKSYYEQNRKKQIAQATAWAEANPEGHKGNQRRHYIRFKEAAFAGYGGTICACCGETEPMFLSIDHVDNNQNEYAKLTMGGHPHNGLRLWKWLHDNAYPPGFQVLCHNCNQGKRINGGVCPHQVKKRVTTIP